MPDSTDVAATVIAPAVPPLAVAVALGCAPDHLRTLVRRGLLDVPALGAGGRRVWTPDQVIECKARLAALPDRAAAARRALAERRAATPEEINPAASEAASNRDPASHME